MKISPETHTRISRLIEENLLNNQQIADLVGCSQRTVWLERKARDAEMTKQFRDSFNIHEPVYRGSEGKEF